MQKETSEQIHDSHQVSRCRHCSDYSLEKHVRPTRHPENFRSDNDPQYSSREFKEFAETYGFEHNSSSPRFPQSNGLAERMVKNVKQLFSHTTDLELALLN